MRTLIHQYNLPDLNIGLSIRSNMVHAEFRVTNKQLDPFLFKGNRRIPPLLLMGALNLDALYIHPFRDGNGRVSRLLLLQCCYLLGFGAGRYISKERIIEQNKEHDYCIQCAPCLIDCRGTIYKRHLDLMNALSAGLSGFTVVDNEFFKFGACTKVVWSFCSRRNPGK